MPILCPDNVAAGQVYYQRYYHVSLVLIRLRQNSWLMNVTALKQAHLCIIMGNDCSFYFFFLHMNTI